MPTFRHARNTGFILGHFNLSPYLRDVNIQRSKDTVNTTTFLASNATYIAGIPDVRFSGTGFFSTDGAGDGTWTYGDADDPGSDFITQNFFGVETATDVLYAPEGLVAGRRATIATAHMASLQPQASVSDAVKFSIDCQGTQLAQSGKVLGYNAAITATGTATSIDNTTSSTAGGAAFAAVLAKETTRNSGTITVVVEHSTDNSTWAPLLTLTTVAPTAPDSSAISLAGTINRYTRLSWTVAGGTTGVFSVIAGIARG